MRTWFLSAILAVFTGALLTGGCTTVGPDFARPSAPVAKDWVERTDRRVKTAKEDTSQWWKVFNDPQLDLLIEKAYQNNPNLQATGLKVMEARAQLGIAVGNQFPQQQALQFAQTYTQTSENSPGTAGTGPLWTNTLNLGVNVVWELDFWGKYRRGIESADANLLASVAAYDSALVSLTGDVASTYISIRTYEERLKVARENVVIQKGSLDLSEARFRNGAVTELDVQQARSILYDTESQIPALQVGLRQAQHGLSILLGVPPGDVQDLLSGPNEIPTPPLEIALGIPAELLRRRPDVQSAELQAAAQCAQIGVSKANLFPQISLTGTFGFLTSDSNQTRAGTSNFSNLFEWRSLNLTTGPSISWPILNYGRIANDVRVQDAKFQQALVNYQITVLNAAKEVEDALVGFLQGQEQVSALIQSVEASKRTVYLSTFQYREGAVDFTPVLNSQQALTQQQDRLIQAKGSVPTNLVKLYKALGGGWQIRQGKDFVSPEIIEAMKKRTNWGDLLSTPAGLPTNLAPPAPEKPLSVPRKPEW